MLRLLPFLSAQTSVLWFLPLLSLAFLLFRLSSPAFRPGAAASARSNVAILGLFGFLYVGIWLISIGQSPGETFEIRFRSALFPTASLLWLLLGLLPVVSFGILQSLGSSEPLEGALIGSLWFSVVATSLAWLTFGLSAPSPLPSLSSILPDLGFATALAFLLTAGFAGLPSLLPTSSPPTSALHTAATFQRIGAILLSLLLLASLLLRWTFTVSQAFLLGSTATSLLTTLLPLASRASLFWLLIQTTAILVWVFTQTFLL